MKRITQVGLSAQIGIAQETISAYESGKSMPSADALCRLADYLGTSTDYLLERTSVPTPVQDLHTEDAAADEMELVIHYRRLSPSPAQKARAVGFVLGMLG